jgi:hypothetical protein
MNEKPQETPAEVSGEMEQPPTAPQEAKPQPAAPKAESAFRRSLRRFLRGMLVVLVIFGLGMVAAIALWYLPMRETATANQHQADAAHQRIAELEEQLASQTALEMEYQQALERLKAANLQLTLKSLQIEVASARIALAQNNPDAALTALEKADPLMGELQRLAAKDQQKMLSDLQARLALAKSELKTNTYAAQSDLDVLARSLSELAAALGSP